MVQVPEELLEEFRHESIERLERVDGAWMALLNGTASAETEPTLLRDVHTLKGDARVVGVTDVALLAQSLEDLLAAAKARSYRVHEDVDVVVTMAIQFMGMLVRKHARVRKSIDLDSFLKQVEEVTCEWLDHSSDAQAIEASVVAATPTPHLRIKEHPPASGASASSGRLASSATEVFLEYLRGDAEARERLHETWTSLVENVINLERAPLAPVLSAHRSTSRGLAGELRKQVEIDVEGDDLAVCPEPARVLGTALLHVLTNAVDHGIERPELRIRAGKPAAGAIRVCLTRQGGTIHLVIEDDGAGVDIDRVRRRAIERGLLSGDVAKKASDEQLLECLYEPGFSTRDVASNTSGRGIGLDAVRDVVTEAGGTLAITSQRGLGSTVTVSVPDARGTVRVTVLDAATPRLRVAVPATYRVRETNQPFAGSGSLIEEALRLPAPDDTWATGTIEIHGQGVDLVLRVARPAHVASVLAVRVCPTPETYLTEIVRVGGAEVVLLRPQHLHG
jgi:two-component system, chemotaxis family, sensor kinase CheA